MLVKGEFRSRGPGGRAILFGDPLLAAVPCVNSSDGTFPFQEEPNSPAKLLSPFLPRVFVPFLLNSSHCQAPVEELRDCLRRIYVSRRHPKGWFWGLLLTPFTTSRMLPNLERILPPIPNLCFLINKITTHEEDCWNAAWHSLCRNSNLISGTLSYGYYQTSLQRCALLTVWFKDYQRQYPL